MRDISSIILVEILGKLAFYGNERHVKLMPMVPRQPVNFEKCPHMMDSGERMESTVKPLGVLSQLGRVCV